VVDHHQDLQEDNLIFMNLKYIILAVLTVGAANISYAQNVTGYEYSGDAFRFSGAERSNTARFNALGGQQTSLGGDLSSLYGNPAGLGMFSKSEFSLTTGFNNNSNKTSYLNTTTNSSLLNPTINNIGIVFHSPVVKKGNLSTGLLSLNFGIGYQKTNFFRNDIGFNGKTYANGLGFYFTEDANNYGLGENLVDAAFNVLFEEDPNVNDTYLNNTDDVADHYQKINRKGGQSNFDLSLGMNISNQLYLGFGVGISSINYRSSQILNEIGFNYIATTDYNANFIKDYDTKGSGVNFKVGAILKPVNEVRIGLSLESPTYYTIDDTYYEEFNVSDDYGSEKGSNTYTSRYNLRTPLKLNGGVSFIIGNKGFITTDVNYLDYSSTLFTIDDFNMENKNNQVLKNNYKEVVNLGIGGEFKATDAVSIRLGYRLMGNPYTEIDNKDYSVQRYTGGVGYRFGNYYLDGAVMVHDSNISTTYSTYNMNNANLTPTADIKNNITRFSLTFGARF
jgi:hypothetical protein